MQQSPTRQFGKRQPVQRGSRAVPAAREAGERHAEERHAEVFATIREDLAAQAPAPRTVPRSFRSAILAGLVTGFFLAGLDIGQTTTGNAASWFDAGGSLTGVPQPLVLVSSLLVGARAAATALLLAHFCLAKFRQTSLFAYAIGGGAINMAFAEALMLISGEPPRHGFAVEIAAGAAAGFFYRLFAGSRSAVQEDLSRGAR